MAVSSFIFGGDTGISYEELQRRRAIADALGATRSAPRDVGEGLSAIGEALGYRLENSRLNKAEEAGKAEASGLFDSLASGFGGVASPASLEPAAMPSAAQGDDGAAARYTVGNQARSVSANPSDPGVFDQFMGTVREEGIDNPYALAAIAATGQAESAFSPKNAFGEWADPSESGQAGQAGGVMSWRADRLQAMRDFAKANGDDPMRPSPVTQAQFFVNEDPALISRLKSAGSVDEAQSLMNRAWRFAGYDRPGGEAARRLDAANSFLPRFAESGGASAAIEAQMAPQQVASADPSFMPEQAPDPRAVIAQAMPQQAPQQPQDPWQGMRQPNAPQAPTGGVQRVAQAMPAQSGGIDPRLIQALSNPYMSDGQKQVLGAMLKQQLSSNQPLSPLDQAELEKTRIETELLRNPRMSPAERARLEFDREKLNADQSALTNVPGGTTVFDPATRQPVFTAPKEATQPTSVQEYEYARQQGYEGPFADFEQSQRRAGATNITTNVGEGDKFYETLDAGNAKIFSGLSEAGVMAQSKLAQIDRLEGLLNSAPQGAAAVLKQAAGEYGINTEGLSDIQAAQALINELVPQQRQPGSGPMSDADLALFKQSLPRLVNQPGGNKQILDTMRGITRYQIEMGQIADAVADRAMTPAQARDAIRSLPNPLAEYSKKVSGGGSAGKLPAPSPQLLDQARKALEQGRDRGAVIKRLEEYGYSAEGL